MDFHHFRASMVIAAAATTAMLCCATVDAHASGNGLLPANANRAVVTVERGFNRSCYNAIPITVFVDGKPVSMLGVGQTIALHMVPGRYRVGVAIGRHGHTGERPNAVAVHVSAHGSAALLADLGPGGSVIRTLPR